MPEFTGNLRTPRLAAAPASPVVGQLWYDTTLNLLKWWNGTAWVTATGGSGGGDFYEQPADPDSTVEPDPPPGTLWVDTDAPDPTPATGSPGAPGVIEVYEQPGTPAEPIDIGAIWLDTDEPDPAPASPSNIPVEAWHVIGAAGEPAFQNSWVSYGADRPPRFRKTPDGRVQLAGAAKSGTNNTNIFQLPIGYRPLYVTTFVTYFSGAYGQVVITTDGLVALNNGTGGTGATQASMDGAHFAVDDKFPLGVPFLPTVTTLPSTPYDGQEVMFVADSTNGVIWRLRYRAASASAYKWEFLGGPPMSALLAPDVNIQAGISWTDHATPGPSVTVPLAGDYDVQFSTQQFAVATAMLWTAGIAIGATSVAVAERYTQMPIGVGSANRNTMTGMPRITGLAAGNELRVRYLGSASAGQYATVGSRWIKATPVRVG